MSDDNDFKFDDNDFGFIEWGDEKKPIIQKKRRYPVLLLFLIIFAVIGVFSAIKLSSSNITITKSGTLISKTPFSTKIGVIPIEGTITSSKDIISQIVRFRKDSSIKAIIIKINSPGGAVGPTQEIYKEIRRTLPTKKVLASVGDVAASGGYYIASAADRIITNPGAILGSIGVIMQYMRLEELFNKIGIANEVIKSGDFKDTGSPYRSMSEKERALLQDLIDDIREQFIIDVSQGRNLSIENIRNIADGRVVSGKKALELGLADQLGNFQDALDLAKELSGITGEVTLIYPEERRLKWLETFVESTTAAIKAGLFNNSNIISYKWQIY